MRLIEDPNLRNRKFVFKNREEAGLLLARKLRKYSKGKAIVLAIPAGGVPVGKAIAKELDASFDVIIVRKIQFPDNPEAGFGAISFDGEIVLNEELVKGGFLPESVVKKQIEKTVRAIRRRTRLFRGERRFPKIKGKVVVLVDDGLASGYTMLAAIRSVKKRKPRKLIVAVPTGNSSAISLMEKEVDEVYCLNVRDEPIFAVADAYVEWYDLSEREVIELLKD